ncbi:MAG: hypothetical protein WCF31_01240 [Candidatus Deferrimicrobiaceae bacterium]
MVAKQLKKFVPENAAYREALALLRAFRAEGTARIVADYLSARV